MLDLPSCASVSWFESEPELMAFGRNGEEKTPQGWADIRMFEPWDDETKRTLNPKLLEMHKQYVDACIDLGLDGIRADVARAKPPEFWDILIPYSREKDPEFGGLGETYTYECASPQVNMPYDRPEDSLRAAQKEVQTLQDKLNRISPNDAAFETTKQQLIKNFQKKCKNILVVSKKVVPLHPQSREIAAE